MSNYKPKNNTASLFKNKKKQEAIKEGKQEAEKWGDYSGSAIIDNKEYWVTGWATKAKSGESYISISLKPKEEQAASGGSYKNKAPYQNGSNDKKSKDNWNDYIDSEDDLPF